ncbi:MAG: nucleotidyl transferase AbiEii/AbiGii toxin family protein [Bacteroidia bacterium]|nr:nucleotidyl transferase AbiEii/AbiGii toxin family protein [Bacteroidia bacterium]
MHAFNLGQIEKVALGLGDLGLEMVFLGGAVIGLYLKNPFVLNLRPTRDIDCVMEIAARVNYYSLEEKLRSAGFRNDLSEDAPICRWVFQNIKVDIMPTDPSILGFGNENYPEWIRQNQSVNISESTEIKILKPEYYFLTKLAALMNRGLNDLTISTDLEDLLILILDRESIGEEMNSLPLKEKTNLASSIRELTKHRDFDTALLYLLPYDTSENVQSRVKSFFSNLTAQ